MMHACDVTMYVCTCMHGRHEMKKQIGYVCTMIIFKVPLLTAIFGALLSHC